MKREVTALLTETKEMGGSRRYTELPGCFSQPKDTKIRPGDLIVPPLQNLGRLFDGGPSSEHPDAGREVPPGMEREASRSAYGLCDPDKPIFTLYLQ